MDHNYIGHNYTGHTYIGHHYMDHNYIGHNYQDVAMFIHGRFIKSVDMFRQCA